MAQIARRHGDFAFEPCDGEPVSGSDLSEGSTVYIREEEFELWVGGDPQPGPRPGPQTLCRGNLSEKGSANPLCPYLGCASQLWFKPPSLIEPQSSHL